MNTRRVVVTGIGALTPIGNNVQDYWKALTKGESGAGPITHFDAQNFKTQFACELKNFNPTDFLDRKESRKLDKFSQYALVVSEEAFINSGLKREYYNPERAGVVWGSGIGGMQTFFNESVNFGTGGGTPRFNPFLFLSSFLTYQPATFQLNIILKAPTLQPFPHVHHQQTH